MSESLFQDPPSGKKGMTAGLRFAAWTAIFALSAILGLTLHRTSYTLGASFTLVEAPGRRAAFWVLDSVESRSPAQLAGLRSGDTLKEVDGRSAGELSFPFGGQLVHFLSGSELDRWLDEQAATYRQARQKGTVEVRIDRMGETLTMQVSPRHLEWGEILHPGYFARIFLAAVFFVVGLLVLRREPAQEERRAFQGFMGSAAILTMTWWPTFADDVLPEPRLFHLVFGVGNLAAAGTIAWMVHFFSVFPRRRFYAERFPHFHLGLKALAVLSALSIGMGTAPLPMWGLWTLGLPAAGLLLADGYLRARLAVNRSRMQWIFVGIIASLTLGLFLYVPLSLLDRSQYLHNGLILACVVPIPVAMALAVESWRLADVSRFLESAVAFSVALLLVAGMYVALFFVLSHIPVVLYRKSVLASGLVSSGVVVALLFTQREQLRSAVRRLLRGAGQNLGEAVEQARLRLFSAKHSGDVLHIIGEALEELFQPAWLALSWKGVAGPPEITLRASDVEQDSVEGFITGNRGIFEKTLGAGGRPVLLAEIAGLRRVPDRKFLDGVLAPILDGRGYPTGMVCLGPRPERRLYDQECMSYLGLLVTKAGLLLELFAARERYEQGLLLEQQERERMGREIHDNVGAELTNVILLSQTLRKGQGEDGAVESGRLLEQLETRARSALQEVRTAAWALRASEKEEDFLGRLRRYATDVVGPLGSSMEFSIERPSLPGDFMIPPEQQLHFFRMFQEILSNVVRHSKASRVSIQWRHDAGGILMAVEDNGKGFNPQGAGGESTGLVNLRRRAQILGAGCEIRSGIGTGVRIEIFLPHSPGLAPAVRT